MHFRHCPLKCSRLVAIVFAATACWSGNIDIREATWSGFAGRLRSQATTLRCRALQDGRANWPQQALERAPQGAGDGSGRVVEKLLEAGVRLLLRSYNLLRVVVHSNFADLIRGRVDVVHLYGEAWCSKRGLTSRRFVVGVLDGASLDYMEVLAGRLTLTAPALGWAEVDFDANDFGNFLVYAPVAASSPSVAGQRFNFDRDGVSIESADGHVQFNGRYQGESVRARLETVGDAATVSVRVLASSSLDANGQRALELALTHFFQNLQIDLAGMELRFFSLNFGSEQPIGGKVADTVQLRLRANIRRIPNPITDRI